MRMFNSLDYFTRAIQSISIFILGNPNSHRGSSRRVRGKNSRYTSFMASKSFRSTNNADPHDLLQRAACRFQNGLEVHQCATSFGFDVS